MPSRPRDRSKAATKNSKGESGIDFGLEMAQRVTVRERIDPAITASLFANYRSSADAVMELVDNAIDSRLKGSALNVLLQVHASYFVIETRAERGWGRPSSNATTCAGADHPSGDATCWASTVKAAKLRLAIWARASPSKPADRVTRWRGGLPTPITAIAPSSRRTNSTRLSSACRWRRASSGSESTGSTGV